jgi:hypothetical protein
MLKAAFSKRLLKDQKKKASREQRGKKGASERSRIPAALASPELNNSLT